MLFLLAKSFVCTFLVAFNFYGAALLFYQPQLLKKIGQLLVLFVPVLLLSLVLKRQFAATPYSVVPLLSINLFLLLMLAGLPSKKAAMPLGPSSFAVKFSREQVKGLALYFTLLAPAGVSAIQVLTFFK
jgi:hypothetical protein